MELVEFILVRFEALQLSNFHYFGTIINLKED